MQSDTMGGGGLFTARQLDLIRCLNKVFENGGLLTFSQVAMKFVKMRRRSISIKSLSIKHQQPLYQHFKIA